MGCPPVREDNPRALALAVALIFISEPDVGGNFYFHFWAETLIFISSPDIGGNFKHHDCA